MDSDISATTIPISLFNEGLAEKIFEDVKINGAKVVMKNDTAECVLLSPEEYIHLIDEVDDAKLLEIATERLLNYNPSNAISESELLKSLRITESDLTDVEDVEIE